MSEKNSNEDISSQKIMNYNTKLKEFAKENYRLLSNNNYKTKVQKLDNNILFLSSEQAIIENSTMEEVTTYLQKGLLKYYDLAPELWGLQNREIAEQELLYEVLNYWSKDYEIPTMKYNESHNLEKTFSSGDICTVWIDKNIEDKAISLWINHDSKTAYVVANSPINIYRPLVSFELIG